MLRAGGGCCDCVVECVCASGSQCCEGGVMCCEGVVMQFESCMWCCTLFRHEELSDGDVAFKMVNENASIVCTCCVVHAVSGASVV